MKTRKDYRLAFIGLILTLGMVFFTLAISSSIHTGIGFGRDISTIVKTSDVPSLNAFLDGQTTQNREWERKQISDDTFIITISGVESAEDFRKAMISSVDDVEVLRLDTFGSTTKLRNNQSFVSLYIIAIVALTYIFLIVKFRFVGILSATQISVAILAGLLFMDIMGYPYTKSLWYTIVLVYLIAMIQTHVFNRTHNGKSIESVNQSKLSMRRAEIMASSFAVIALLMYTFYGYGFTINASYVLVFTFTYFLVDIMISQWAFNRIKSHLEPEDLIFTEQDFFGKPSQPRRAFYNILILVTGIVIVMGLFSINNTPRFHKSKDFAKQNVLIVPHGSSRTYLEIEAILNSIGMFENQIDYQVSEQGYIWIYFDENVDTIDLQIARESIAKKTGFESSYYSTDPIPFPLVRPEFYLTYVLMSVVAMLMLRLVYVKTPTVMAGMVSLLSFVFYVLFSMIFSVRWNREMIFVTWAIPFIVSNIYSSELMLDNNLDFDNFVNKFVTTAFMLGSILASIISVILIVIPLTTGIEISKNFFFVVVSILVAIVTYYGLCLLKRKVFKSYDDFTS